MKVVVDADSPVPPFEQLRQQLTGLIAAGALDSGTRLPSIRQLAADLALAPGTVARAYAELEAAGLVTTGGARGTRVAPQPATDGEALRAADRYIETARSAGLDLPGMLALLRARHG